MLMTLGHRYGYPRLPLKPGVSITEGSSAWWTFIQTESTDMLALAAEAARTTWSDDPMTNDLYYVAADYANGPESCRNETGVCQDSTHEHFDVAESLDGRPVTATDRIWSR